jgi:hypothetical protein
VIGKDHPRDVNTPQREIIPRSKNPTASWAQWLTPIILATQEAEIRRIAVQN